MRTNTTTLTCGVAIPTPEGVFTAFYSTKGLCGLDFPPGRKRRRIEASAAQVPARVRRWHAIASKALKLAVAGRPPKRLPPLDLSAGTEFQQQVWRALRKIGWGRTRSYGQVAQAIGKPKAVRAVGGACGANPVPVFVPCHRVLAANNSLGGYSSGLNWKRALLRCEGIKWFGPRKDQDIGHS
jgi:AraC family transcriptional regulator, regulatory protein of adaptative response / methylated-DNA-[protein]-cysteine methyltransferase